MKKAFVWITLVMSTVLVGCGNQQTVSTAHGSATVTSVPKNKRTIYLVSWNNAIYSVTQEDVEPSLIGKQLFKFKNQTIYTPKPVANGQIGADVAGGANIPAPTFLGLSPTLNQIKGVDTSQAIALGTTHDGKHNYVKCVYESPLK